MNSPVRMKSATKVIFRLLLIPCLVFSNVLIALNWILMRSLVHRMATHRLRLNHPEGVEYDVYTFLYDDLDSGEFCLEMVDAI